VELNEMEDEPETVLESRGLAEAHPPRPEPDPEPEPGPPEPEPDLPEVPGGQQPA
jgi:hypothetical protein